MIEERDRADIEQLLEILACPVTRERLRFDPQAEELVSVGAGLAYPIRDGIPVLLPDQARRIDPPAE